MFAIMAGAIGISVCAVALWLLFFRPKSKKRHRKHRRKRHQHQHNPTLAETGGLPPRRDPQQPPAGP